MKDERIGEAFLYFNEIIVKDLRKKWPLYCPICVLLCRKKLKF